MSECVECNALPLLVQASFGYTFAKAAFTLSTVNKLVYVGYSNGACKHAVIALEYWVWH